MGVPVLMPTRMTVLNPLGQQLDRDCLFFNDDGSGSGTGPAKFVAERSVSFSIGRRVISETESSLPGPPPVLTLWGELLKVGLLILAVLLSFAMALSFLASLIGLFSLTLAGLVMTLASSAVLFTAIHLVFTIPGIVQLRRGSSPLSGKACLLTRSDFLRDPCGASVGHLAGSACRLDTA